MLGGVLGSVAFFWRVWDTMVAHVHLEISADVEGENVVSISTTIDNKSGGWRKLNYAALLIMPMKNSFEAWVDEILGASDKHTTSYRRAMFNVGERAHASPFLHPEAGMGAILPLAFYYAQHLHLGQERLHWREEVPSAAVRPDERYLVRFVVFSPYPVLGGLRWRVTTDSFRLKRQCGDGA